MTSKVKYKRKTKKSVKKSKTQKSVKKSVKKSKSKKSVKRKTKKSKSKKSVKRKIKKSVKRKSKKSVKRKSKKSVKRKTKKSKSKKSVKRKSKKSVKRKTKKSKGKKSVKRESKKSVKRKSKKSVKRKSKKSVKRESKKSVKRESKKSLVKRSVSEDVKKLVERQKSFNKNTFKVMLANKYSGEDPTGYFMSEKLDGYRALFYNGPNGGELFSRNNKPFYAPKWFLDNIASKLPVGTLLDGELYTKRQDFDNMGIVRKKIPVDSEWKKITFMVFDVPLIQKPFKERYNIMKTLLKDIPNVKLVEHFEIKNIEDFNKQHQKWVSEGAEGSMLRDPDSSYENKRSNMLLKVKDFMDDEAIVEGMEFGEGRNSDVMGNLIVKWAPQANKKYKGTFDVGSGFTDEQRKMWKTLFKKGTIITIKYFEIQKSGKPRFPIFQNIYHKV